MSLFKTGRINMKVTLVHKTYREHYILFGKQYVPGYLSELIKHMKERLKRYESPILDHFNESFTDECWMGRISWIDKDGDEILLVDERGYDAYIDAMRDGEMGTIIVRLASTKPEPNETLKQKPIRYKCK